MDVHTRIRYLSSKQCCCTCDYSNVDIEYRVKEAGLGREGEKEGEGRRGREGGCFTVTTRVIASSVIQTMTDANDRATIT